jgi:hypothetical protein
MSSHPPPVPPEQRSDKGSDAVDESRTSKPKHGYDDKSRNLGGQGRQGNVKQNTTNTGYQQDR